MGHFIRGSVLLRLCVAGTDLRPAAGKSPDGSSQAPSNRLESAEDGLGRAGFLGDAGAQNRGIARGNFSGYAFVSHKDVVPLMTAWGKDQYEQTKPSWGPRAVADSTDMVNPTTGKEVGCEPTGVPRIWVHPFPTKIVQTPGNVYLLHEFNHETREIYTQQGKAAR